MKLQKIQANRQNWWKVWWLTENYCGIPLLFWRKIKFIKLCGILNTKKNKLIWILIWNYFENWFDWLILLDLYYSRYSETNDINLMTLCPLGAEFRSWRGWVRTPGDKCCVSCWIFLFCFEVGVHLMFSSAHFASGNTRN